MEYTSLVRIYHALEQTAKRLEKTKIISDYLKTIPPKPLKHIIYLLQGNVFPLSDENKIGFSSRLTLKAISTATGTPIKTVELQWSKKGDLGTVAEALITKKTQTTLVQHALTIEKVFTNIRKLATLEGQGTVERKIGLVAELLTSAQPEEARFIVRTILEELRVGVAEGVLRDAIARAYDKDVDAVEAAYYILTDYAEVAVLALSNKLHTAILTPGKPLKSMLALLSSNVEEAFKALGSPLQCEYKLDGFRLQIHKTPQGIHLFTRRLEEVTTQFPDIVALAEKYISGNTYILDTEAVGIHKTTKKYVPFQSISQRIKRKHDIHEMAEKYPVELNVFDILYYNGASYINLSLIERRKQLEKVITNQPGKIKVTEKLVTSNVKEANAFFEKSLKHGTEGLMLKNVESPFRPGRYVGGWMKLKRILEPLDLVIVGAEYGSGKRAGVLSSYVIACQDNKKFLTCGMVATGVKEKETEGTTFTELTKLLKPLIIEQHGRYVNIKAKIIIEVGYEEIQRSPSYTSGYALRFPRFHMIKLDKTLAEINSLSDIKKIYHTQKRKH